MRSCSQRAAGSTRLPRPALTIAITHDGFVKLDGKAVTLDELGALVAAAREGVAEEGHPYGGKVSSLRVTLDIEEDALWRHVLMVIDVLAEQKVWRVTFPGGRDWPLPADSWHELTPDGKALLTRVLVLENGTYAVGDLVAGDVKEVGRWIDSEPTKDILCRVATIRAASRVPWRLVHPVFDLLRSRGSKRIDFYALFPDGEHRRASPLPVPRPGTPSAEWSGFWVVDHYKPDTYEDPGPLSSPLRNPGPTMISSRSSTRVGPTSASRASPPWGCCAEQRRPTPTRWTG